MRPLTLLAIAVTLGCYYDAPYDIQGAHPVPDATVEAIRTLHAEVAQCVGHPHHNLSTLRLQVAHRITINGEDRMGANLRSEVWVEERYAHTPWAWAHELVHAIIGDAAHIRADIWTSCAHPTTWPDGRWSLREAAP
jgi:hypothetical protein